MNDAHIDNQLDAYLDDELSAFDRRTVDDHLQRCSVCKHKVDQARGLQQTLVELPVEGPAADFFERALNMAAEQNTQAPMSRWVTRVGGALAAGLGAIVVIGMLGRSPAPSPVPELQGVTLAMHESRTLNLVFSSTEALEGARLIVELPQGLELDNYPGEQRIRWKTNLQAGRNVLPLDLIAVAGSGGEVVALLEHGEKSKTFRLRVDIQDATSRLIIDRPIAGQA